MVGAVNDSIVPVLSHTISDADSVDSISLQQVEQPAKTEVISRGDGHVTPALETTAESFEMPTIKTSRRILPVAGCLLGT